MPFVLLVLPWCHGTASLFSSSFVAVVVGLPGLVSLSGPARAVSAFVIIAGAGFCVQMRSTRLSLSAASLEIRLRTVEESA